MGLWRKRVGVEIAEKSHKSRRMTALHSAVLFIWSQLESLWQSLALIITRMPLGNLSDVSFNSYMFRRLHIGFGEPPKAKLAYSAYSLLLAWNPRYKKVSIVRSARELVICS